MRLNHQLNDSINSPKFAYHFITYNKNGRGNSFHQLISEYPRFLSPFHYNHNCALRIRGMEQTQWPVPLQKCLDIMASALGIAINTYILIHLHLHMHICIDVCVCTHRQVCVSTANNIFAYVDICTNIDRCSARSVLFNGDGKPKLYGLPWIHIIHWPFDMGLMIHSFPLYALATAAARLSFIILIQNLHRPSSDFQKKEKKDKRVPNIQLSKCDWSDFLHGLPPKRAQ